MLIFPFSTSTCWSLTHAACTLLTLSVTPSEEAARKGGEAAPYEEWTVEELQDRAGEIGTEGRSAMDKEELIKTLRDH